MNRLLFVFIVAGCGAKSTPTARTVPAPAARTDTAVVETVTAPPEPATRLIDDAPCVLRDANVEQPLHLMVHGVPFAIVRGAVELELRAAAIGATATVKTADFTLTGDIDLKRHEVRPREPLQLGWLGIRQASPGTVNAETMTLAVKLPTGVSPTTAPFFRLPCDKLTLTAAPDPADGKQAWLKPASKIAVRVDPKGAVAATIETPRLDSAQRASAIESLDVRELARDGSLVRIRTRSTNYIEGWIDAAMLGPAQKRGSIAGAVERPKPKASVVRCPHEVAIYVRADEAVRVGTYHKDAQIVRREGKDEVVVDLGLPPKLPVEPLGSAPELHPFVRASALTGCASP